MSPGRGLANSLVWSAAGNWSRELINFGVFLLLSRLLGPASYGIMGMVAIFTAIANAFLVDGTSTYVARAETLTPEHIDACFWLEMALALVISLVMVAGAPALAQFYHEDVIRGLLPTLALLPLLYALNGTPTALLRREMRFRPITLRQLLASLIGGIVGVTLAFNDWKVWSLALMMVTQGVVSAVTTWSAVSWRPRLRFSRVYLDDLLKFAANTVTVRVTTVIDQQVPRILIGATLGKVPLGFFTMAWRILEVLAQLTVMPIGQVAIPALGALQQTPDLMRQRLASLIELAVALALPSFIGLASIADVLVPAVLGPRWTGGIPLLEMFCVYGAAWAFIIPCDAALIATGSMRVRTLMTWIGLALLVAGFGLVMVIEDGAPDLAALGGVIVVREVLYALMYSQSVHRRSMLSWETTARVVFPFLVAAFVMLAVIEGLKHIPALAALPPLLLLVMLVAAGAASYAGVLSIVARRQVLALATRALTLRKARHVAG